ncbi:MAG TPA: aminomethyl-transferring glycine dehydrogenase subunit GcvPA [Pirellulales bacterium]|jgi:glycine dehydrogenase subunit 1|nr:aminomethyl-transferring glycine dehydrogenase subunit GcvPA [Pirellulales bacterium]
MPYLPNTAEDRQAMLSAIGLGSLDELFAMVPAELRLERPLDLPPALTEIELTAHMAGLAAKNVSAAQRVSFLGGGSYDHFIPAVVDALASRGEFYTSYTPYQPEVSQGNLQVFFEYQSLITRLTGMEVSNASLYDGGSAAAEAVMMSLAATGRNRVVVPASVHPEFRQILATYLRDLDVQLVTVPAPGGTVPPEALTAAITPDTACVLVQHPNFFGCLEDVEALGQAAHAAGAVFVVSVDPISLGLLKRPGDYGADIVVAEGQSLGSPMAYGGPYLGIIACREAFVRRLPGRIAGQTIDRRGQRCWVLTLQTREQHIRREKATSNICTNQGLYALRAAIYLSLMGPHGMREVATLCLRKSHYALRTLTAAGRLSPAFERPMFKEFVVRDSQRNVQSLIDEAAEAGFFAGVPLGQWYPELSDCLLIAVTEKRTKQEIDRLAAALHPSSTRLSPAHA